MSNLKDKTTEKSMTNLPSEESKEQNEKNKITNKKIK